jgi:hypothetical protein
MPEDKGLGVASVLQSLFDLSKPDGRVSQHLLRWDMHEMSVFASRNPGAVTEGEPPHG